MTGHMMCSTCRRTWHEDDPRPCSCVVSSPFFDSFKAPKTVTEADVWKRRAEALYQIVDNIDTASDIAKDNDIVYRALIKKQIENSQEIVAADGSGRVVWFGRDG